MICYIASYPRSGNAWIRTILLNQLGLLSSTVHDGDIGIKKGGKTKRKNNDLECNFPIYKCCPHFGTEFLTVASCKFFVCAFYLIHYRKIDLRYLKENNYNKFFKA